MLTIRLLRPSDINEISELTRSSLGEIYPTSFYMTVLEHWPEGSLIATENDRIVGFIMGVISNVRQARILMLAVREDHRRSGIAKMLLRAFISSCLIGGICSIILEVRISNIAAINLYTEFGFSIIDNLRSYYRDGEDGLRMEIVLQS